MSNNTFGRRLCDLRLAAGFSQRELARAIEEIEYRDHFGRKIYVTAAYISRIESGERWPSISIIHALADVLNSSAKELMPGPILTKN